MRSSVPFTRLALIALASCLSVGHAQAQAAPGAAIPPGWVWQGVWQDGRWNGQWVPGPGVAPATPGMPMMMPPAPPAPMAPVAGEQCRRHHGHDQAMECNGGMVQPAYPVMPQPAMVYPPMAYTMVPVMVPQAPAAPCVEKRTVTTTEYVIERHYHTWHPRPHHKDKRVYTGS